MVTIRFVVKHFDQNRTVLVTSTQNTEFDSNLVPFGRQVVHNDIGLDYIVPNLTSSSIDTTAHFKKGIRFPQEAFSILQFLPLHLQAQDAASLALANLRMQNPTTPQRSGLGTATSAQELSNIEHGHTHTLVVSLGNLVKNGHGDFGRGSEFVVDHENLSPFWIQRILDYFRSTENRRLFSSPIGNTGHNSKGITRSFESTRYIFQLGGVQR
mmetsp:Transcript_4252/g.12235  ORF Transcript_4252/g.12235 Transcript_4252/m.12235 type:complete len:212 (+) Transcript_4252:1490-2125(+)